MRPVTSRGGSPPPLRLQEVSTPTSPARPKKYPSVLDHIRNSHDREVMEAMLGKDESGTAAIYSREEYCGACGIKHTNPDLLDLYPNCENCQNCIRSHAHLRQRYVGKPPACPLEIIIACYGDVNFAATAYEVTSILQHMVNEFTGRDRLSFRETQHFDKVFGKDPSPGKPKQLRFRYRMLNTHGFISLDVMSNNRIPESVLLLTPEARHLTIMRASYGHPRGKTTTGRMSYDVTENLQGLVDLNRGSYVHISAMTPLSRIFGDPCKGYIKDLQIEFDISGRAGSVEVGEIRGRLKRDILIETSPSVSPLIFVATAYYGLTPTGIKERLQNIEKKLGKISLLEHRKNLNMNLKPEDVRFIREKPALEAEKASILAATPMSIDVTSKVQRIVEQQGGFELFLDKSTFDANFVFGNPIKDTAKLLEINLKCYGHDSEMRTDSKEVSLKGYQRNFILGKKQRFMIAVSDAPDGRGVLQESLHFTTNNVLPLMIIKKAMYGHPHDNSKAFDVTTAIQNLVKGKVFRLKSDVNLDGMFGDPCIGVRKVLKIEYVTRGFTGAVRIREHNDCAVAAVELGFPPASLNNL